MAGLDSESIENAVLDEVRTEVCGGEDAFVSAMHEFIHNVKESRFSESAQPFLRKIKEEQGYMDSLRSYWAGRECTQEKLPSNADLLKMIKQEQ